MAMLATPVMLEDGDQADEALAGAAQAKVHGADLVEWRVDTLVGDDEGRTAICRLVQESVLPSIVTCRIEAEGGGFDGPESERIAMLEVLAQQDHVPTYVDLEYVRLKGHADLRTAVNALRAKGTRLICSAHDFTQRPPDLLRTVADMGADDDCDVIKIAFHAAALREALECADLLAARPKPMIALAMGQMGLVSRVLAGAWGGLLTFAALDADATSAPGQPTLSDLEDRYRFRSITAATKVYGLIGFPLGASPGFERHNAAFQQSERDAVYLPLPVREGWERFKADILELVGHPHVRFRGGSVTMPHKANCLQLVRDAGGNIDEAASAAGAANTLVVDADGGLSGANTDVIGVVEPLRALGATLKGQRAAVLGAGGAARAACVGLLQAGACVRVFNRTAERAKQVATDLAALGDIAVGGSRGSGGPFDVVVQCTSVGMAQDARDDPAGNDAMQAVGFDRDQIADGAVALESVLDPVDTIFVEHLRQAGASVACGLDMWLAQAAGQEQRWAASGW